MYVIFHWIFMIWYVLQFSIEFSCVYTFNEFEFLNKFGLFVNLMYKIFPWIFTILYFQQNQILNEFKIFVHLMYWIFHWIFTIWLVLRFSIEFSLNCTFNEFEFFLQIRTIWTSNFQLNFHDFVLSTKSNLSTSSDYLYIFCT